MNQDGDVSVEAAQGMSLKAGTDLSLEGVNVSIKGSGRVNIEADGSATLSASGTTTVKAAGALTVQGSLVSVKGTTSFSP
jgi:uncharacterized protein (DUF2345 family)